MLPICTVTAHALVQPLEPLPNTATASSHTDHQVHIQPQPAKFTTQPSLRHASLPSLLQLPPTWLDPHIPSEESLLDSVSMEHCTYPDPCQGLASCLCVHTANFMLLSRVFCMPPTGKTFFPILVYVSDYLNPTYSKSFRSYLCEMFSGALSSLLQYAL